MVENGSQSLKRNVRLFRLPLTASCNTFYLTLLRLPSAVHHKPICFSTMTQHWSWFVQVATVVLEFEECVLLFPQEKKWIIPNYGAPTWSKLSAQIHSCIHASVGTYIYKLGISISVRYSKFFVVNFPSRNSSVVTSMRTWRSIRTEVHEGLWSHYRTKFSDRDQWQYHNSICNGFILESIHQ